MVRSSASAASSALAAVGLDHAGADALLRAFQRARDAQPDIAAADDDDALGRLGRLAEDLQRAVDVLEWVKT
jgi:predicted protein tyrosine phosphatase